MVSVGLEWRLAAQKKVVVTVFVVVLQGRPNWLQNRPRPPKLATKPLKLASKSIRVGCKTVQLALRPPELTPRLPKLGTLCFQTKQFGIFPLFY